MKIIKIIIFILLSISLWSCQGAKDALQSKKRSDTSDEFLVKKKNPLTTPPDYNKMPIPIDEEESKISENVEENLEISEILKIKKSPSQSENTKNNNSSLLDSILEKINN